MNEPTKFPLRVCVDKTTLLKAFQSASEAYSMAVAECSRSIGTAAQANYETLHVAAERARKFSYEVREQFEGHIAEHGC